MRDVMCVGCTSAMTATHDNSDVQAIWRRYGQVRDYGPLRDLPAAREMSAQFESINL